MDEADVKAKRRARRAEAHADAVAWLREGVTPEEVTQRLRKAGFSGKGAERVVLRADDAVQRAVNPDDREAGNPTTCADCGESLTPDAAFCDVCGAPVLDAVDAEYRRTQIEPALVKGRKWIGAVAILYALGAILFGVVFESGLVFAINITLAGIQTALWWWSKRDLLPAAITSLVLFVTVHLVSAIADPKTIVQGIIVKVVFVVVLARAIQAGLQVRTLRTSRERA